MQNALHNPEQAPRAAAEAPIGRIVSVTGSQAIVLLEAGGDPNDQQAQAKRPEMGTLLKIDTPHGVVLGLVSALSVPMPISEPGQPELRILEVEFVGELQRKENGAGEVFQRGVSAYPALGDRVYNATNDELAKAYACTTETAIRIGWIKQDASIPAMIEIDDLLGKHFAVLGTTGTGKSCTVALILRQIMERNPQAHIVLLDPHSEYAPAFGDQAELITPDNLNLPYWLLTFEEVVEVLIGQYPGREVDIEILRELIPAAKGRYGANQRRDRRTLLQKLPNDLLAPSVDTPVPYRISDLVGLLDEQMGKLDLRGELTPFKRLKSRVEMVSRDPRFSFMFGNVAVHDTMAQILGRLFRVPVNSKPISIIELAGLPPEVISVVVSVISRLTFDFAMRSEGRVPVTLVCEEAHRYIPADDTLAFAPTKRALARIAKEGRKYGAALSIVSQRPSELDPTILSQCNTLFAMRLSNERDQEILKAAISDAASSLLEFLPSLSTGEVIAFGEGVSLPTRINVDLLPRSMMPKSSSARFSQRWRHELHDTGFLDELVARWRAQTRIVAPDGAFDDDVVPEHAAAPATAAVHAPAPTHAPVAAHAPAAHAPAAPHAPVAEHPVHPAIGNGTVDRRSVNGAAPQPDGAVAARLAQRPVHAPLPPLTAGPARPHAAPAMPRQHAAPEPPAGGLRRRLFGSDHGS